MNNCDKPGLIPIAQAIADMTKKVIPLTETESVPLLSACDRVLGNDVFSPVNVPPATNSAMDGYALHIDNLSCGSSPEIIGTSMAGTPFTGQIESGQCVRIMTGAVIPQGAAAVIMQEQTSLSQSHLCVKVDVPTSNNFRLAGEDIQQNECVLREGTKLVPAHLSLLASIGIASVQVLRSIKVALLATGDELTPPGQPLSAGAIYESNRYALHAMLSKLGCSIIDLGIVKDVKADLRAAFLKASQQCDLVISSGGVSVGDADFVKEILMELGEVGFWKVAIKPGKPFAFGRLGNALFCGLPGNPVSSFVTFQQLVVPLIETLSGQTSENPFILKAVTTHKLRKRVGRADFQRGYFKISDRGDILVEAMGNQGSGVMSSITKANCYILLNQHDDDIEAGSRVNIQPFIGLV